MVRMAWLGLAGLVPVCYLVSTEGRFQGPELTF